MQSKTIILSAVDFVDDILDGYTLSDDFALKPNWTHNNVALTMSYPSLKIPAFLSGVRAYPAMISDVLEDIHMDINVEESGEYFLFVRSHGTEQSGFQIYIDGSLDHNMYGNENMSWKRGSVYKLEKGLAEIRLHMIKPGSSLDMIVLSKDSDYACEDIARNILPDDVELLKEYKLPQGCGTVKFGDVLSDGSMGFAAFTKDYSVYVYDFDGNLLWNYIAPAIEQGMKKRAEFEPLGAIWDIDNDGKAEVIHWEFSEDKEWLVASDGRTGHIKYKTEFPSIPTYAFNNYRIIVARLAPGYPSNVVVFSDCGGEIFVTAYDKHLNIVWRHKDSMRKDHRGHYIYPYDMDQDGLDEIFIGALCLDSDGSVIWDKPMQSNDDHMDTMRFADIDGDGSIEQVVGYSNKGVNVVDPKNGDILWQAPAAHTQQLEIGKFIEGFPENQMQVAASARWYSPGKHYIYGNIWWYDCYGSLIKIWPKNALNGNPDFSKGDWYGDGSERLFWYKFMLNKDGTGTYCFPNDVYHMFDFMGEGAENPITLGHGFMRVYGCRYAKRDKNAARRDLDYMYKKVTNHTHY